MRLHTASLRVLSSLDQSLTFQNPVGMVKPQNRSRYAPFGGERYDSRSVKPKMIGPSLCSWVEKGGQLPSFRVKGTQVSTLEAIAIGAGQGQIIRSSGTPVLFGNDVLHFKRQKRHILRAQAILASLACSPLDNLPQSSWNVRLCHVRPPVVYERALWPIGPDVPMPSTAPTQCLPGARVLPLCSGPTTH